MPTLLNLIIMGLLWIRKDNVIIKPVINILIINSYGLTISIKITLVLSEIKELTVAPFVILIKGARKRQKPLTVFKVLLKDITKILRLKITRIPAEIRCHRASCLQANGAEGRKNDRLKEEKEGKGI